MNDFNIHFEIIVALKMSLRWYFCGKKMKRGIFEQFPTKILKKKFCKPCFFALPLVVL